MQTPPVGGYAAPPFAETKRETPVAWGPIIAGALAAAVFGLLLLALGSGIGFASFSPWSTMRNETGVFTAVAAIWLIVVQWVSSGVGGYLTGRLRCKRGAMHDDEVFFRDTAHGFLSWALATLLLAVLLATILGGQARPMAGREAMGGPFAYAVDELYRADHVVIVEPEIDAATTRILARGLKGNLPDEDRAYLAQLVAEKTGIAQPDADKRVDEVIAQEKSVETKAAKIAASISIYLFLSLLMGAFIASVAAALGGKRRDEY